MENNLILEDGCFYFIKEEFFELVKDENLQANHKNTDRPHYYAIKDDTFDLYWMIPCSTNLIKYKKILIKNKNIKNFEITKVQGREIVILYQDMFPIHKKFIKEKFYLKGVPFKINNVKERNKILNRTKKYIDKINKGVKIIKSSPNVLKIKDLMIKELINEYKNIL